MFYFYREAAAKHNYFLQPFLNMGFIVENMRIPLSGVLTVSLIWLCIVFIVKNMCIPQRVIGDFKSVFCVDRSLLRSHLTLLHQKRTGLNNFLLSFFSHPEMMNPSVYILLIG